MVANCVKTCATCRYDESGILNDGTVLEPCSSCENWNKFEPNYSTPDTATVAATSSALDVQVGGAHYKAKGIQPIAYIFANKLGFCEGNVVKYVTRYKDKNGVEDLKKARHYLDMLIEELEKTDA